MAINTTSTQGTPYFDDWTASGNASKNYLKILFQPGRSVQVRELNQMQSAIQSQIDLFGQHVFVEGTRVLDGEIDLDKNVQWVDLDLSNGGGNAAADTDRPLIGKTIYTGTNLASATVSAVILDYELKSGTEYRFYLRYTSNNTNFAGSSRQHQDVKVSSAVTDGDGSTGSTTYLTANAAFGAGTTTIATGYSLKIHNNSGVFFVRGYFVEAAEQTKYIDQLSTSPRATIDGKVGFTIVESNVTAINDNTLYDNATGSTNASAPGADRYVITLSLALITDDSDIDSTPSHVVASSATNAVDIVSINNSEVTQPVETKYNKLGDTLAKRTFEESGDYALQPFVLDLREHYDNGENRGKYTATSTPVRDATKFVATLEPGRAYIKGNRVEILKKQDIEVSKARTTEKDTNLQIQATQGSFIEAEAIEYLPITDLTDSDNDYTLKESASGATVGTCKISGINYTGRLYQIFIRDLALSSGKVINDARFLSGDASDDDGSTVFKAGAKDLTATTGATFTLFDVGVNNHIFELPAKSIKSVTNVASGTNKIRIPKRLTTNAITVTNTNDVVLPTLSAGSTYYQDATQEYIAVKAGDGVPKEVDSVSITNNGLNCTVTLVAGHGATAIDISYSFRTEATLRTKTKTSHTESAQGATTYAIGDTITLDKADVFQMTSLNNGSGTSFLDNFQLDNGQTATSYGVASLICIKAISSSEALTPAYNYFEVDSSNTGNDAFWVDGYNIDDAETGTKVARARVGTYLGTPLLDAIDFRGSSTTLDPNGIIEITDVEYYLPRYDRIVLKTNGEFEYLLGDTEADAPAKIPENSMLLYDLDVPAYTESASEIEIGYVDNRRYTMKDIAKLEKRVTNLEYYTSLSLLEKMSKDQAIADDSTGEDRFKNGIIVDEFKGHGVGNPFDPGYRVAIEPEKGVLRPSFETFNLGIYNTDNSADDATTSGSTTQIGNEDLIRMKAASIHTLIDQPFASVAISVNPFDVASWVGEIRLSPQTDEWKDTVRRPDVLIQQDDNAAAIQQLLDEKLAAEGIRWNDWNTTWSGVTGTRNLGWQRVGAAVNMVNESGGTANFGRRRRRRWWRRRRRTATLSTLSGGTLTGRTRRMQVQLEQEVITTRQVREGIQQFTTIENVQQSMGDKVVEVSFVPFIRSRKVYFHATGFKPNTTLYPFFDDVDISGYSVEVASSAFVEFRDDTTRVDHTGNTHSDISSTAITTDDAGEVYGYFVIPQNDGLRFRTGEREFQLSDQQDNNLVNAMTYGKATYSARGLREEVEETIISTRQVNIEERRITDTRTLTSGGEIGATAIRHRDPLAQTFVVDIDLYPQGVFLKDVDLFFKAKHSSLPVMIQLVPAENGIPTQKVIPFSDVRKMPADVNVSEDASAATNFVFKSPIYLKPGIEYAIVVLSNSPDFTLWHSEVGGTDVGAGGQRITKNPYTGVALKSANASTWTPDQNKDFKFKMRYMKFDTSTTYTVGEGSTSTGFGSFVSVMPTGVSSFIMDSLELFAESVTLPGTSISYVAKVDDGTSQIDYNIIPGELVEFDESVTVDANTDIKLFATLSTTSEFLTPVIDVTRLSFLAIKNNINGQTDSQLTNTSTGEGRGTHGTADARYITKMVALENQSSRIDLYMDVKRPSAQCNVHAYVRFDHGTNWTKLDTPQIPISNGFREIHFRTGTTDASALGAGVAGERKFDKFQVKLVMTSVSSTGTVDSAFVPEIRNFRGIATA
jgi:hypothetical protein